MITDYNSRKNEVLESYTHVEKLVTEWINATKKSELPDPTKQIEPLLFDIRSKAEKVKADRFSLMIAGESKSGKSTFINAYLGLELLPMDVKQCTSSIVEIKYGEKFKLKATYADGKTKLFEDETAVLDFLRKNAALDDDYRDIPVPTINNEILVKSGRRAKERNVPVKILEDDIKNLLAAPEVQSANIYSIPNYNQKIRQYINAKRDLWTGIVIKIEIFYPFKSEKLRGIEIVDSPGVCARGGVAEITSSYIENADAIIFLKSIAGSALESNQFNDFLRDQSVERNQNALFLVLTRAMNVTPADLDRLEQEAQKQFKGKIDKDNIIVVDSKAELYAKQFENCIDIELKIRELNKAGSLDEFVKGAWFDTGDKDSFIKELQKKSRFEQINNSLEIFGRKAHYLLLGTLLDSICKLYTKISSDTNLHIDMFRQKAEDPTELAKKIADIKNELDILNVKMYKGVADTTKPFRGDDGTIRQTAERAKNDFKEKVGKIDPDDNYSFNDLENLSMKKIDEFKKLEEELQKNVVEACDKTLIELSEESMLSYESIKPNFTEKTFEDIKNSTESQAKERHSYTTGVTFKKTHTSSVYSQKKHFGIIKENIMKRLDDISDALVVNLWDFVVNIGKQYTNELKKNADAKSKELDAIMEAKIEAEQIKAIIDMLCQVNSDILSAKNNDLKLKGGIEKNVQ